MTDGADAYSIPACFEAELVSIYECWRARRRGDNDAPFSDDVNLPSPGSGADDAVLIDVFENPLRFRLACGAVDVGPARSRAGRKIPRLTRIRGTSRSPRSAVRRNSPFEGAYLFSTQLGAGLCTNCTTSVGKRTDRDACRRRSCHRRSLTVQPDCFDAAGAVRDRAKMTSGAHLEFHTRANGPETSSHCGITIEV